MGQDALTGAPPPVEKKVTEEGSRVGIIVQVLGNQDTVRSTHRIWAAHGGYLRGGADGSSREAAMRATMDSPPEEYPQRFFLSVGGILPHLGATTPWCLLW
jgi:hypothetical protein